MVCKDFPSEEATRLHCNCKCISLWCCSSVESGGFHSCTWKSSLLRIFKICNQFNTTHKNVWIASRNMALGPFSMLQNLIWLWLIWLNYQLCILSTSGELSTSLHSKYLSTSALNIQPLHVLPLKCELQPFDQTFLPPVLSYFNTSNKETRTKHLSTCRNMSTILFWRCGLHVQMKHNPSTFVCILPTSWFPAVSKTCNFGPTRI